MGVEVVAMTQPDLPDEVRDPFQVEPNRYAVPLSRTSAEYCDAIYAHPPMGEWIAAAIAEPWTIEHPKP